MKKQISLIALSAVALGSVIFTSCKKEETPKKYAKVNITHASPNSPAINFIVSKDTLNKSVPLAYGSHTGYIDVEAGSKTIAYKYAGVDTSFLDSAFSFKEKQNYSLYIIDSFHKSKPIILTDDLSEPANGKAHLRLVYLSPDSNEVNFVRMIDTATRITVFPKTKFKDVTSFTAMTPGVYDFELHLGGTDSTILSLPTLVLNNRKIYTVIITGFMGATGKTQLRSEVFINKW
jgi:hypothetical protein